jgi:RNA polymerase sigma-70 factor (ECF subfamily)
MSDVTYDPLLTGDATPAAKAPELRGLDEPSRAAERARYIAEAFAAHHRPLRSFLSRLLRNEDDIADTVQEVFLRIAQLPDPSKLDLNPRAYLFRTAERLVIDRVRRDTFRQAHLHGPLDDPAPRWKARCTGGAPWGKSSSDCRTRAPAPLRSLS